MTGAVLQRVVGSLTGGTVRMSSVPLNVQLIA